jgi:L-glyceraldehyde 3-phosphate reductase
LNGIPVGSRASKDHGFLKASEITGERIAQVKKLNELAVNRNQSLAQMAIGWLLKDKRITSVLVGASSVQQLDNSIDSLETAKFNADELNHINSILHQHV